MRRRRDLIERREMRNEASEKEEERRQHVHSDARNGVERLIKMDKKHANFEFFD